MAGEVSRLLNERAIKARQRHGQVRREMTGAFGALQRETMGLSAGMTGHTFASKRLSRVLFPNGEEQRDEAEEEHGYFQVNGN